MTKPKSPFAELAQWSSRFWSRLARWLRPTRALSRAWPRQQWRR